MRVHGARVVGSVAGIASRAGEILVTGGCGERTSTVVSLVICAMTPHWRTRT